MNRAEWLLERKKGIGASEAAAVLGISPWSSPVDVWAKKKGLLPEMEDNERLKTGRLFEEPIAQLYADREGVQLIGGGDRQYDMIWHPSLPVFATPDRLVVGVDRGLEVKTVDPSQSFQWGEDGSGDIPIYYTTQVAICMAVSGRGEWDVAAFFGMNDFRVYRLVRDMELEETILSRLSDFWTRFVVGNEEPAIDGSEACAQYLSAKYPRHSLPLIGAGEVEEKLLADLFSIREQVKSDDAIQTEYENKLKAIIGDAEGIQGVCGKVLWRQNKDSAKTDWEAIAKSLSPPSELVVNNTIVKPGVRVFRATKRAR